MVECGHAACVQLRRWGKTRMYDMISELGCGRDKKFLLAELIVDWAWSREDACCIWTELWSPQLMEDLETHLQFGVLMKAEIEKLEAVAMSMGRVMARVTLAQWELKVLGTKKMLEKLHKWEAELAAEVLLRRAKDKKRRDEKKRAERKEEAA